MKLSALEIGDKKIFPPIVLAPIAGWTNRPFRIIAAQLGAGLVTTELISSEALTRINDKTLRMLKYDPCEGERAVQIFGSKPDVMAKAAKLAADEGAQIIDINMGCPAKKVVKNGAGACLLKSQDNARSVMKAVVSAVSVPVTVKIRSGLDDKSINAAEIAKISEDCGISGICIHPRTAVQGFRGSADWNIISEVKKAVSLPVIGNGDISTEEDVKRMFDETECDGVMIGRSALGSPWIFRNALFYLENGKKEAIPSLKEIRKIMAEHLQLTISTFGDSRGSSLFKKHSAAYVKGMRGAINFREKMFLAKNGDEMKQIIGSFFQQQNEGSGLHS